MASRRKVVDVDGLLIYIAEVAQALEERAKSVRLQSARVKGQETQWGMLPLCCASAASSASMKLKARATASPIRSMAHLGGDGWRESSRRLIGGVGRVVQASSTRRLIAVPHVHVIQTRLPSTPPSSSPQYWCSSKKA